MMIFFFIFLSPALFECPRGDRIYCLCTVRRSRKRMPPAEKSIRLRNRGCGLIMQKRNRIAMEWKDWTISTNFFAWMVGWIITKHDILWYYLVILRWFDDIWNVCRTNQVSYSRMVIHIALVFELLYLGMFSYGIVYTRELRYTLR